MLKVNAVIGDLLYLALIVFSVIAVLKVLRGKDAGLPFLSKMAGGDLAVAFAREPENAAAHALAVPSAQESPVHTQYAQPPAPASLAPVIQDTPLSADATPAQGASRYCASCSAPLQEGSRFCTECGAKTE